MREPNNGNLRLEQLQHLALLDINSGLLGHTSFGCMQLQKNKEMQRQDAIEAKVCNLALLISIRKYACRFCYLTIELARSHCTLTKLMSDRR